MKLVVGGVFFSAILSCILVPGVHEPKPYSLKYDREILGEPIIPSNNPLTEEGVKLGRLLFYDPILSANNQMSCGTCHIQSKSFTDGRKLAIGTYGDTLTKNTMSLINLAWGERFFWDGRAQSLEALVRDPITKATEMGQDSIELVLELLGHEHYPKLFSAAFPDKDISMENVSKAVAQFLRTIVSNGFYLDSEALFKGEGAYQAEQPVNVLVEREESLRGSFIRFAKMCSNCHLGTIYGNELFATNGISEKNELTKVPALVNIFHTAPYMHDGRFSNLKEVLTHYDEHLKDLPKQNLSLAFNPVNVLIDYDLENADQFFKLFEDPSVLVNPNLSNPFDEPGFSWADQ